MKIDFQDRVVVITGGGTGIGRAMSLAFADSGADVVVNYRRSRKEAEETVADIEKIGTRGLAVQADVTDWDQVQTLFEKTDAAFGRVDVLINNAGGVVAKAPVHELDPQVWADTIKLNLTSVFLCCKAAIPRLPDGSGRIINVSSISGHTGGGPTGSAYGAAKGGVITLTRCLAHELAPRGITVTGIAPGVIDTRIHQLGTPPDVYQQLIQRIPLKRDGKPEDLAGTALLLASSEGGFITGETIHVNGGMLMV